MRGWLVGLLLGVVALGWAGTPMVMRDQCILERYIRRIFDQAHGEAAPQVEEKFRRNMSEEFRATIRQLYEAQIREGEPDVCPDEV